MKKFFWLVETAYNYHKRAHVPWKDCYRLAEGLYEMYDEHPSDTPAEAVIEDLTYWTN